MEGGRVTTPLLHSSFKNSTNFNINLFTYPKTRGIFSVFGTFRTEMLADLSGQDMFVLLKVVQTHLDHFVAFLTISL
jgi:hypothetical protein